MPPIVGPQQFMIINPGTSSEEHYRIGPISRLDLIRSVWREGKPPAAVAYTLLQRYAFLKSYLAREAGRPVSLSEFLRSYVTPINPRWFPDGDKHIALRALLVKQGKQAAADDERRRAVNRVRYASTQEPDIPKKYIELVDRILAGEIASPVPNAVHFRSSLAPKEATPEEAKQAALSYAEKQSHVGNLVPLAEGYRQGVNWFFTAPGGAKSPALAFKYQPGAPAPDSVPEPYVPPTGPKPPLADIPPPVVPASEVKTVPAEPIIQAFKKPTPPLKPPPSPQPRQAGMFSGLGGGILIAAIVIAFIGKKR